MIPFLIELLKIAFLLQLIFAFASLCTWFERKASALIQNRVGANRAGVYLKSDNFFLKPFIPVLKFLGILGVVNTLFCDAVKAIFKEDFVPSHTSRFLHTLAPFASVVPIFMAFAVIPFAPDFVIGTHLIRPQVAQISVGILFVFAMTALAVYGVMLAGWSSDNKFSLLGALRASAQMISYEIAMGTIFVTMILSYATLDLYKMVELQIDGVWGVVNQPLSFLLLFIVGMAETKRGPFDLPESESELVAGYFTEYSGMKFLLFWLGEFAEIALFSMILTILFLGGWHLPGVSFATNSLLGTIVGHFVLVLKTAFLCLVQITLRWTLPRFRYDQLMRVGWNVVLPISLVNLFLTAVVKVFF
ncbi:MAG TPA: NADH-quinone oxidoreductase subunit H [Oligoflexia bacterium]|nr:NADH-quinone oxidoreductase subunit H [Oligoflexia bacterium]HMP27585.1 NADH-quinone oxidoreductase subunit H [Oligoflexia bacterium]